MGHRSPVRFKYCTRYHFHREQQKLFRFSFLSTEWIYPDRIRSGQLYINLGTRPQLNYHKLFFITLSSILERSHACVWKLQIRICRPAHGSIVGDYCAVCKWVVVVCLGSGQGSGRIKVLGSRAGIILGMVVFCVPQRCPDQGRAVDG